MATGHYRNGILLTPVTADAIAELLAPAGSRGDRPVRPGPVRRRASGVAEEGVVT